MSTQTIQQRINEAADKKLADDVTKAFMPFYSMLSSIGYRKAEDILKITPAPGGNPTNVYAFMGQLKSLVLAERTDGYRDRETQEFLAKVNSLEGQIEELRSSILN